MRLACFVNYGNKGGQSNRGKGKGRVYCALYKNKDFVVECERVK